MATLTTTALVSTDAPTPKAELLVYSFLAGYAKAKTRAAYAEDLGQWIRFCADHRFDPLEATRTHIELFGRHLESLGRAPATVARRVSTTCVWYRWLFQESFVDRDPAANVRRISVPDDCNVLALDRHELGALVYAAEGGRPDEYALICLLALNGLRVSEACEARIEDLALIRGHRTLHIIGKGSKPAVIPLVPRTARAVDKAAGERTAGPIILNTAGGEMTRSSARWVVEKMARKARIAGHCHPHALRHGFVTACLDAGVPLRDVQIAARHADPRTTTKYDRNRSNLDRHAAYVVGAFIAGAN